MIQRYRIVKDCRSCFLSCEMLQVDTIWGGVIILTFNANAPSPNSSSNQVVVIITLFGVSVGVH